MQYSNDKSVSPPYPNRGAQNTYGTPLRACVDWVQVTFKNFEDEKEIIDVLGMNHDDFREVDTGKYGYTSHLRSGHISIYYTPNRLDKHLEITGQGCREYEQHFKRTWSHFFALLLNWDVSFTRLDVAIDDFKGYFTLQNVLRKIKNGHVRSRFKQGRSIEGFRLKDGKTEGLTIYFGDPSSRLMVRMYDKLLERISKNQDVPEDLKVWNRIELQMRKERAEAACLTLAYEHHNTGQLAFGTLSNYLNFCNPTQDTNKSRWPICPWWEDFLQGVEKLKLSQVAPDATIQKSENWLSKQVSATLAMIYEAHDHDVEQILKYIYEGLPKLKDKHFNMIDRYKKEILEFESKMNERKKKIVNKLTVNRNYHDEELQRELEKVKEEYDKKIREIIYNKEKSPNQND